MPNHFTPIGNHATAEAMKNDTIAISSNVNSRFKTGSEFKKKHGETPLRHIKRISKIPMPENKRVSKLTITTIERAKLFLAIREQVKHA